MRNKSPPNSQSTLFIIYLFIYNSISFEANIALLKK